MNNKMNLKISLKDKVTLEGFKDDAWFDENIWENDLDKNEIVKLVLEEISKDIKDTVLAFEEKMDMCIKNSKDQKNVEMVEFLVGQKASYRNAFGEFEK